MQIQNYKFLILHFLIAFLLRGVFLTAQTVDTTSTMGLVNLSRQSAQSNKTLSLSYAKRAYEQTDPTNKVMLAHTTFQYGYLLRLTNQFSEAEKMQAEAMKLSEANGDIEKTLRAQLEMARNQHSLRNLTAAMENYVVISETYENKIAPIHGEKHSDIKAQTLERMGVLLSNQKAYEKAEAYLREAIEINKKRNDLEQIEIAQNGLGNVFLNRKEYAKAVPIFEDNLRITAKLKKPQGRALNNMGICYKGLRKFDTATIFYQRALESYRANDMTILYYQTLVNIGDLFDLQKMPDSAQHYLSMAMPELEKRKSYDALAEAYFEMVVAKTLLSDYESALKYQKMYVHLRDSLTNAFQFQTSLELQRRFDLAKNQELEIFRKDKALSDLKLQQQQLALTNQRLATEKNVEKIALLQKTKQLQEAEIEKTKVALKAEEIQSQVAENQLIAKEKERQAQVQIAAEAQKNAQLLRGILTSVLVGSLLVGGLVFLLFRSKQKVALAKEKLEYERLQNEAQRTLNQVRMETLRAQMNPHFMFNCMNTIEASVLNNQKLEASKLIQKFSKLMRLVLDNSQHETVSLEEDLAALKLYMDLEKTRYVGKFDYQLDVDEEALDTAVPPLLIQPFVENAILHGLRHRITEGGLLTIKIDQTPTELICILSDNGIGREKAAEIKRNSGKLLHNSVGLKLTTERLKMFAPNSSVEVSDLNPNDENIGTKVVLKMGLVR